MTVSEAIKRMLRVTKFTQAKLAEKIGKQPVSVSSFLRISEGIKVKNLMAIADACDYDLVLVRKGTRLPYGVLKLEHDPVAESAETDEA